MQENPLSWSPGRWTEWLGEQGIRRFYFAGDADAGRVRTSHAALEPIAEFLGGDRRDFRAHEGLFFEVSPSTGELMGVFIHDTHRGQAQGGTRYWEYATVEDYLRDGLRLAIGMTQKNALAGLWWGGGKGVIARNRGDSPEDPERRAALFRDYGRLVSSLGGAYVAAEDVGTTPADLAHIFEETRFTTCIPPQVGGSGNPSAATAAGVVRGMEAALGFRGEGVLEGKTVAVQGLGHVAEELVQLLLGRGVRRVVASELRESRLEAVAGRVPDPRLELRRAAPGDASLLAEECDILAPCATGAILGPATIPQLRCRILCGAANNQLEDADRDDRALWERGLTYVPDFLVNRMGIVNCANEQFGVMADDPWILRHLGDEWEHSIYRTTARVLRLAAGRSQPPGAVAVELAEELAREPHPLFGHRGRQIMDRLLRGGWAGAGTPRRETVAES